MCERTHTKCTAGHEQLCSHALYFSLWRGLCRAEFADEALGLQTQRAGAPQPPSYAACPLLGLWRQRRPGKSYGARPTALRGAQAGAPVPAPAPVRDVALAGDGDGGLRAWLLLQGGAAAALGLAGGRGAAGVRLREAVGAEARAGADDDDEGGMQLQVRSPQGVAWANPF
jgi:hypothetical protein